MRVTWHRLEEKRSPRAACMQVWQRCWPQLAPQLRARLPSPGSVPRCCGCGAGLHTSFLTWSYRRTVRGACALSKHSSR